MPTMRTPALPRACYCGALSALWRRESLLLLTGEGDGVMEEPNHVERAR